MSNPKKEQGQKQKRDFISIFFIENHIQTENVNIRLSENNKEAYEFNSVQTKEIESNPNYKYIIYTFKINNSEVKGKKLDIKLKIEGNKGYKSEFNINITDFERNQFIYDFKFIKEKDGELPSSIALDQVQQFDIYLTFIRKELKKIQNSQENEDFIFSTQKLLIGPGKKYEFSFYLQIFLECFSTKYIQRLLMIFRKDKIGKIGEIPQKKKIIIANIISKIEKDPKIILEKIEGKKRNEYGRILVGLILYYNYNFRKERIQEVINNENLKEYMNKALIEYNDLFKDLQLTNEEMKNLINESNNSKEIINSLKYCKNVLELIKTILIDSIFKKILVICKSELDAGRTFEIDIESIVTPRDVDNMKEIYEVYKNLFNAQKETLNNIFINFKSTLCEKYISFFEGVDVNRLFYLKKLIEFIKFNDKNYEIKGKDINKIIEETTIKLINESKTIDDIVNLLKNCNDVLEIIETISIDLYFNKICDICNSALKKKPTIDIESMVQIKREDNLKEIYEKYEILIKRQKECLNYIFINFKPSLCEQYISLFEGENIDNLFYIKNIMNLMKSNVKNFEIKGKDINKIIHNTGLKLSMEHKLKNIEILNFIRRDDYYNDSFNYGKKAYRSLDILNGLDPKSFNEEFYLEWKKIDWYKIFEHQYIEGFLPRVSNLIKDLKDFDMLFRLLDISKNPNQEDFNNYSLNAMQEKYIELIDNSNNINNDDLIKLIFYSDQKNADVESFLKYKNKSNLQAKLSVEKVNEIYINLMSRYKDLITSNTKNIITDFFTTNPTNANPENLLKLIKSCPELSANILQNINDYNIQKENFFELEEKNCLKVFKGLLEEKFIENPKYQNTSYVQNVKTITKELVDNIKDGKILYTDINRFYDDADAKNENENKKKDNILYDRLKLIVLNKEKDYENYKAKIDNYHSKITEILEVLKLINEDFLDFYYKSKSKDIQKIKDIINSIKTGELNVYENYINDFNDFNSKYMKTAKIRSKEKKSAFFQTIFKINKQQYKRDEEKCINETEIIFGKLINIFNKNEIQDLDKDVLDICLKTIKGKEDEAIKEEIKYLIEIFGNDIKNQYDEDKIIKTMITLSKREVIFNIAIAISIFIEKLGLKHGNLWKTVKEIITNLEKKDDKDTIENSIKSLNKEKIDISILNNANYLKILLILKEQPEAIDFIIKSKSEDINKLHEVVGEADNGFLTTDDIECLVKCMDFMAKLGNENSLKNQYDNDFLELFKKQVENNENKDIVLYFNKYVHNYTELKELNDIGLDKSQASKKKIELICKKSLFKIGNEGAFYKGTYYRKKNDKENEKKYKIKRDILLELRDRAQLTKNVTRDEKEKGLLKNYKKFVDIVSQINDIYYLVKDLYISGYPEKIEIQIVIDNYNPKFIFNGSENIVYNELTLKLLKIIDKLQVSQINGYNNYPLIRFIYGRQFNLIINALKGIEREKISPFLMYLTNSLLRNEIIKFEYTSENDIYKDMINNCEKFLQDILTKNNLSLKQIYENSLINVKQKDFEYKGVYLNSCEKLEKDIFQLYKYLTKNTPTAQNILLCNRKTTLEELTAFLFRAILCEFNSCFIIGGVELLKAKKKSALIELLNKLYVKNYEKMKSCLIILYIDKTNDIFKSLELLKHKKILDLKNIKDEIKTLKIDKESKVEIYTSDQSGVGKSTQIKIRSENKDYIYFPLGGVFNREDIIQRLKNLTITKNSVIHLDLYDTDETDLMMEFLFSILITKLYGQNEHIFYFPKEVEIKIEIPNGFIDFMGKFPILTLLPINKLYIKKLPPLIVPNDITSNVQVVANYFKAKNERILENFDLYFDKVSDTHFEKLKTTYKAQILKQEECQQLIFSNIEISEPNYYQISSFIDILGLLFKNFTRNFYLSRETLSDSRNNGNNLKNIRTFTIESFIKITKHFTEGVFTKIVKSQQKTFHHMHGIYNENEDKEKGMKELVNVNDKNQISFKDIDPSLIFFHVGNGQSFSIITNKEKTDEEYIKLCDLLNCQNLNQRVELPDYKNYENLNLIEELNKILGNEKPVDKSKINKMPEINEKENDDKEEEEEEEIEEEEEEEKRKREEKKEEEEIKREEKKIEKEEKEEKKTIEEITKNYIFTPDNFIKMILILLRIRANIPVIMMGETGCGKTSLIRKLSELFNKGSSNKMKILNIHAGINDKDIIKFLEKKVIKRAKIIEERNQIEKLKFEKNNMVYVPKKVWVFLDEINTCKSMGLISELMCKHTYQGKPLPPNIVFIGACNPYREVKEIKEKAGLNVNQAHKEMKNLNINEIDKIKKSSKSKLVYTVNPLPHSLLNFVFNFGKLEKEDEEKYIDKIINDSMYKIYIQNKEKEENEGNNQEDKEENKHEEKVENKTENKQDKVFEKIHGFAKKMIVTAHNFVRTKNDISSVSLREIRRFNIFYEFFFDYLIKKKGINLDDLENKKLDNEEYDFYKGLNKYDLQKYSIILSVFVCYYLRLTDNKTREELVMKLNEILKEFSGKEEDFLYLPIKEENYIIKNIELDRGIAKNRALLDNIFSLFIAINNKVPIFIVGKPGCSKSLSVQLIINSMKGSSSNNILFKRFPKIILNSYQGSTASTSEGVERVFNKARKALKNLKNEDKKSYISMIYFDEMGLAEHSPKNPLKVIHSELEYDLNEGDKKVAFVGISNWVLDASKMNRGIYLSIPEPEKDDIALTAYTIGKSYDETLVEEYKKLYENLGLGYYDYKSYLKKEHCQDGKDEFHGNRDFYHLIKNVGRHLLKLGKKQIDINIIDFRSNASVERNFGGIQFDDINKTTSIEKFKNFLSIYYENIQLRGEYEILERIKENITDLESRYLLIISKSSINISLLESVLPEKKQYCYYIGSQFENDIQSEQYILNILNKIQLHMGEGNLLILKNLESVYPALYDLFNQNFTVVGGKKYARISIGSSNNAYSLVNDNFRCIVNVDENQIDNEEPPFLNRFEKHILSYEFLLKVEYRVESNRILEVLNEMIEYDKQKFKGINYDLKTIFISLDKEEIQEIAYISFKRGVKHQNIIYEVINKISLILPQDILLCQRINGFQTKYQEYSDLIIKKYNEGEHSNLRKFLEKMENIKNVVYTFSNILDYIENLDKFKNPLLGEISKENLMLLIISEYKSENEFEKNIDIFLKDKSKKICLIKFKANEGNFMNYIKFLIENKEKNSFNKKDDEQNKKAFIFIVYLTRINNLDLKNYKKQTGPEYDIINTKILKEHISLSSEYYQIFIDNLNGSDNLTLNDILTEKGSKLYKKFIDFDKDLEKNIYISLSYMNYNIPFPFGDLNEMTYVKKLIDYIKNDMQLIKKINDCLKNQLNDEEDIISTIFKTKLSISPIDIDIISVIKKFVIESYITKLSTLYYKAEKDHFFSTLLSINEFIIRKGNNNEKLEALINKTREAYLGNYQIFDSDKISEINEENIEEKKFEIIEEYGMNEINIILGLKLPGVKRIISPLIKNFKNNIKKKYEKNENSLRGNISEELIDQYKSKYLNKLKAFNNSTYNELNKDIIILSLIKDDYPKDEFFNLFLEDYYTLFIINSVKNIRNHIKGENDGEERNNIKDEIDFKSIKNFLKLIIEKRNESNDIFKVDEPEKKVSSSINWIEAYSDEIENIIIIFSKLAQYIDKLNEQIEEIINKEEIKYEISKRSKGYKSIVNLPLFYALESVLKVVSKENFYLDSINNPKEFSNKLNISRELLHFALKMEVKYDLYSKEVYSLQEILAIINCLYSNKKLTHENIKKIVSFFSKESYYINQENKENELIKEFNQFYETLISLIGNDSSFNKLMSIIFKNEFYKINKEKYIAELIGIIMKKDEFIYNNSQLFKDIIFIDNNPGGINNNRKYILERQNFLYKSLNNCKKPYLEEIIINIFENKILNYFDMITQIDFEKEMNNRSNYNLYYQSVVNKNPNETLIIFNLSLTVFKECINYLDYFVDNADKDEKNNNLYKLYAISYIKIYLSKLVYFSIEKEQFIPDIKDIIDVIKGGGESKFRTVIKIYIFKLFYHLIGKNYDDMIATYNFKEKGFEFTDILLNKVNDNLIREIICEEKLSTIYKDFPLLNYFIYTEYRTREDFIKELDREKNYKEEYPLLYIYLKESKVNSNVKKLKYLPDFNEFNNYMIDYYSFRVSREEAKDKILKQEELFTQQNFENRLFKNFLKSWNKIKKNATKYKDYPEMGVKDLTSEDKLIYFLNDVNEQGYGMYLASAYQNFINWQNGFLKFIIQQGRGKNVFNNFIDNMNKKIDIYDAHLNQIVNLYDPFNNVYEDFNDLINTFSRRRIFSKDGTIDYSNYNKYEYDFSLIEEELANCILPGKCLFEEENNHYITFWGEGFNGGKANNLQMFWKKYKQKNLDEKERRIIMQYLTIHQKNELKQFFNSIQLIIFYLINNNNIDNENEEISKITSNPEDYLKIDKICSDFFDDEEGKDIKINKLLGVYLFSEHFCFNEFCENLQKEYKTDIENKLIEIIKNNLLDRNNNKVNEDIPIKDLASAIRRFISRYLVGKKQKNNIDPKAPLLPQLKRVDLWSENIWNIQNLYKKISNLIGEFKLTVGQSLSFYLLIKEEDENEIKNEENREEAPKNPTKKRKKQFKI